MTKTATPEVAQRTHIGALDGLRGVALLVVFLRHTLLLPTRYVAIGDRGVDLFFCLSGFLITGILVSAKTKAHYFRNFYARRALRIFPLYYFFLILYYLADVKFHLINAGAAKQLQTRQDLHWAWFYGVNLLIVRTGRAISASLNHFWTLSVEEHFYFAWPLIVRFLDRKRLLIAGCLLILGPCLLRVVLMAYGTPEVILRTFTLCRVDSFAIGGMASVLIGMESQRSWLRRFNPYILWTSLSVSLLLTYAFPRVFTCIGYDTIACFFTSLILVAVLHEQSTTARVLRSPGIRFLGKYSYCMYVFHWPIQLVVIRKFPIAMLERYTHSFVLALLANMALVAIPTVLIALATWNLFEKRFLSLKRFFPEPKSSTFAHPELAAQ